MWNSQIWCGDFPEGQGNRQGVQRRSVRRDAHSGESASAQVVIQADEEEEDVRPGRVVVEYLVEQSALLAGVHHREHTEGAVV